MKQGASGTNSARGAWTHRPPARKLVSVSRHLPPRVVLVVAVFWFGNLLVDAVERRLDVGLDPTTIAWGHFLMKRGALSLFWMLVTLGAVHAYGERPLNLDSAARRLRSFLQATLAALLIAAAYSAYLARILAWRGLAASWVQGLAMAWPGDVMYGFFRVWQIIIAVTAYHSYRHMLRRKRESEELKARLQQTELLLFRAQLEPHFLFNTLNSIASLVRLERPDAATDALHQLSSLLRGVLEVGQRQVMPWQWEREFAQTYIALQQLRFADRLDVRIDAPDVPLHAPVPILLLQPLLENAIVHGPLADGRRCVVLATLRPRARYLELEVANEVATSAANETHGVGLPNIRARLAALFGDDCELAYGRQGARFVVRVAFPIAAR
jgi:hypothetical protein